MDRVPLRACLLACLTATIWGVNFVVIDKGLGDVPPLTFVAIRFAVVAIPAVFIVARPKAAFRDVVKVGLFMSLGQFAFLYTALHVGMPSGLASLVLQAQVLLTVLVAVLQLGERPRRAQLIGIVVGSVGLLVVAVGRGGDVPTTGLVLTLAAALSWAFGNVAARRIGPVSGLSLTVYAATVAPLPLLALSLVLDGPHRVGHALAHLPASAFLSTAFTAYLASLLGYGIWNTLLSRYPAYAVTPFALLVPPVGIASAWIVEHERPNAAEVAGGVLLMAGVGLANIRRRQRAAINPADRAVLPVGSGP